MAHDVKGKLIKVGDKVNIPCTVESVEKAVDGCNVTLRTVHPMPPSTDTMQIVLNGRQVKKTLAAG